MGNTLRILCAATLFVAVAPLALAQGIAAQNAAELATGVTTASEFVPLPLPIPENTECYNNGPLANSIGTHAGGGDESVLQGDETLFGYGAQGGTINNEMADDYTASEGCTEIKGGVFYTYQTGATAPSITGATARIYGSDTGGNPDPSNVVCTGTLVGPVTFTNVYRVTTVNGDSQRRLQRVEVGFSGCSLTASTKYWVGIQYTGTLASGPWQPPVPRPFGSTTCPQINGDGAQQDIADAGFATALNGTCEADIPFVLLGEESAFSISASISPTSLPGSGGQVTITFTAQNNSGTPATLDLWIDCDGPGSFTFVRQLASGTLPSGPAITRSLNLFVPPSAPNGQYNCVLKIGNFPNVVLATSNSFTLTKGPAPLTNPGTELFEATPIPGDVFASATTSAVSEVTAYPNPFAGRTTLSFSASEATQARLAVYDVLGRQVAVLVDGAVEAGTHQATFDASALAAGTYVYRLVVGNAVHTGRVTVAH